MATTRVTIIREQTLDVDVEHEDGDTPSLVKHLAWAKAHEASPEEWDDLDWDAVL